MDYDLLIRLLDIPEGLDRGKRKGVITQELRAQLTKRDKLTCQICGRVGEYGNPGWGAPGKMCLHHIIPNGEASLENVITLCKYCHGAVHLLLYSAGKWRYVPMK